MPMHADRFYGSPNFETPILQAIAIIAIVSVTQRYSDYSAFCFAIFAGPDSGSPHIPLIHTYPYISIQLIKVPEEAFVELFHSHPIA